MKWSGVEDIPPPVRAHMRALARELDYPTVAKLFDIPIEWLEEI